MGHIPSRLIDHPYWTHYCSWATALDLATNLVNDLVLNKGELKGTMPLLWWIMSRRPAVPEGASLPVAPGGLGASAVSLLLLVCRPNRSSWVGIFQGGGAIVIEGSVQALA